MKRFRMTVDGEAFVVDVALPASSSTLARLAQVMPYSTDAHHARVAGDEFFMQMSFIEPVENAISVHEVDAGTIVYSPERALLACFCGTSQEVETVTLVGRVTNDAERIKAVGRTVQRAAGVRVELEVID